MLSVLDAVLGCILAIYLFICGLFVLRDSMAARRMHIAWAVLKIPLAVLGAIATTMMMNDISAGTNGAAGGAQTVFGTVAIVLTILLGLIYPIALLIVLNTQTARGYYSPKE
jgi:tellurite resistance protein TehA-like permease